MSLSFLTKTMNRDICTFLVIEITLLQFLTKNNRVLFLIYLSAPAHLILFKFCLADSGLQQTMRSSTLTRCTVRDSGRCAMASTQSL